MRFTLSNNVTPKAERQKRSSESERGGSSAPMTYVAMPCCGTTRAFHDVFSGTKKIKCKRCERRWYVTAIGAGQFRFSQASGMTLHRREPSTSPLAAYKRTAPLPTVEGGTGESDTRLLAIPKPNDLAGAPKPKRANADVLRALVLARDNGNCAACGRNTELVAAGYRVAEEQDAEHRACQRCGKTVPASSERCDDCGGGLGASFAFRTRYRDDLERRGYPRKFSRRYNGSESLWASDHAIPIWEGGADELANLQTLCLVCHRKKTAEEADRRARKYGHKRDRHGRK